LAKIGEKVVNSIILHGELATEFGDKFDVDIDHPAEGYRALACQLPGFKEKIRAGQFYLVREMPNGEFAVTENMFYLGMNECRFHIIPIVEGANSKGVGKIILGIALIGASFIPGLQGVAFIGLQSLGTVAHIAALAGIGLALGGLAQILAPQPTNQPATDAKNSFLFGGNINPSGQNIPVPLAFGRMRIPGIPVATQIVTNEVNTAPTSFQLGGFGGSRGDFNYTNYV
jgi:predicted phage tail protein